MSGKSDDHFSPFGHVRCDGSTSRFVIPAPSRVFAVLNPAATTARPSRLRFNLPSAQTAREKGHFPLTAQAKVGELIAEGQSREIERSDILHAIHRPE